MSGEARRCRSARICFASSRPISSAVKPTTRRCEVRHFDGFDLAPTARRLELDPPFHDIIPPTEPVNRRRSRRKDQDFSTPLLSENLAVREDGSILVTAQNKNELWLVSAPGEQLPVKPTLLHTFEFNTGFVVERKPDRFLIGVAACIGPMRRVRANRGRPARCPRGRHGQGLHDAPMTAGQPPNAGGHEHVRLPRSVLTTGPLRAAFFARLVS